MHRRLQDGLVDAEGAVEDPFALCIKVLYDSRIIHLQMRRRGEIPPSMRQRGCDACEMRKAPMLGKPPRSGTDGSRTRYLSSATTLSNKFFVAVARSV